MGGYMSQFPTFRARVTYYAHLFKALTKQHHGELVPKLKPYIPDDAIIVDIGAHAGQFSKLFSKMAPAGHIYAFEPGAYALSILKKVKAVKGLRNVTIVPYGLSDTAGEASLHTPIKNSGSLGFGLSSLSSESKTGRSHATPISLTTLDTYFEASPPAKINFIKADIEGWELNMLKGAQKTLARYRPAVMLEINDAALAKAGTNKQALVDYMQSQGYAVTGMAHKDVIFTYAA